MVAILRAMHARALALGLLLISTGCTPGEDGGRPQPFAARIVCSVERWLQQNDYRRREPGSGFCDAEGLRIPRRDLDPAEDEQEPSPEPSARQGDS